MSNVRHVQKLAHATPETAPSVQGRRDFFTYQDLGVTEASLGKLRAQTMTAIRGMTEPTGWHYHDCEGQFIYSLKGWVELEFETGDTIRLEEGESLFIPGGMRHNEIGTSDDLKILELSIPAKMETVACDPPSTDVFARAVALQPSRSEPGAAISGAQYFRRGACFAA